MAVTVALTEARGKQPSAPLHAFRFTVTGDASYPTGGYPFDPGALLQSEAGYDKAPVALAVLATPKAGHTLEWNRATAKLLYRLDSTGLEVANAVDVSVTPGAVEVLVLFA